MYPGCVASRRNSTYQINALIYNAEFDDVFEITSFDATKPGTWYFAIHTSANSPSAAQIIAGTGGGILQAGSILIPFSGTFETQYTTASGNHGDTRTISYLLVPENPEFGTSNIIRLEFTLNFAPAPFENEHWEPLDAENGGLGELLIYSLPFNNGFVINDIKYRIIQGLTVGSWVSLGSATTGYYEISGFTDGVPYIIELLAVNAQGESEPSSGQELITSNNTQPFTDFLTHEWRAHQNVLTSGGTTLLEWRDVISNVNFNNRIGTLIYHATGGPNGGPYLEIPSGGGFSVNINGSTIPFGNSNRTMISVFSLATEGNFVSAPMYGSGVSNKSFGVSVDTDEKLRCDFWQQSVAGTTTIAPNVWTIGTSWLRGDQARIHRHVVNAGVLEGGLEGFKVVKDISTDQNILRYGRSLTNLSRPGVNPVALLMFNRGLNKTQHQAALNYVKGLYF